MRKQILAHCRRRTVCRAMGKRIQLCPLYGICMLPSSFLTAEVSHRNGDVVRCQQDIVPQSEYHKRLEEAPDDDNHVHDSEVRFWSDYNRVYFAPQTVQEIPDTEWENSDETWDAGTALFTRFDHVGDLPFKHSSAS